MLDPDTLRRLRAVPTEWRRRGLTPPADLARMVEARVAGIAVIPAQELSYADFFVA